MEQQALQVRMEQPEQQKEVQLQEMEQQAPQLRIERPAQQKGAVIDWQNSKKRSVDAASNGGGNIIKRPKRRNKNRKNYAAIDKGYSSGEDGEQVMQGTPECV